MKRTGIDSKCNNPECCFAYRKEAMFFRYGKNHRTLDPCALKGDYKCGPDSLNTYGSNRFFASTPECFLQER